MQEAFRPVHYMGNKFQYLDAIGAAVDDANPLKGPVLDPFSGTGVVSRKLADNHPVISADVQAYSAILTGAQTSPDSYSSSIRDALKKIFDSTREAFAKPLERLLKLEVESEALAQNDPARLAAIIESGSLAQQLGDVSELAAAKRDARNAIGSHILPLTWYYGGVYFSYQQALDLDCLGIAIRESIEPRSHKTALASLMGVASDIASTVGNHFAQPIRPHDRQGRIKRGWVSTVIARRAIDVFARFSVWIERYSNLAHANFVCDIHTMDFRAAISGGAGTYTTVYADPPYTRDHYSRFYHVLETIALQDDPGVTFRPGTNQPSRGLYRKERHQSSFSIRSEAQFAFEELLGGVAAAGASIVLSYSPMGSGTSARPETRLISIDDLAAAAQSFFRSIEVIEIENSRHSRFNRSSLNGNVPESAEILLVGKN